MSSPITIEVTAEQLGTLVTAMIEKSNETESYLRSSRVGDPDELDLCCDAHRGRYEHRKTVSDALERRERQEKSLLGMLMVLDRQHN